MLEARTVPAEVRVLIVDDSPVAREVLRALLESDAGIRVVGMAASGREAVDLTARLKPDLVTMDLVMPGMDGMEATQRIMADHPTPIVFLSAFFEREGSYSRDDALAAGALDVIEKPSHLPDVRWQSASASLRQRVRVLASVPVVRHIQGAGDRLPDPVPVAKSRAATTVVGIGASTGGPRVLDDVLSALPHDYSPAILVVQHMADGFMGALVETLRRRCVLSVKVAADGDRLHPGRVLIAPPDAHLTVRAGGRVCLDDGPPVSGFRPSIDVTFTSLARAYRGRSSGVLLTGMGTDGAGGLLAIRRAGGRTMVQDEASCVVFGMPRAAIEAGAAEQVLAPAGLTRQLLALHGRRRLRNR
jgi:two-component system chemotaxis response regulator CheB